MAHFEDITKGTYNLAYIPDLAITVMWSDLRVARQALPKNVCCYDVMYGDNQNWDAVLIANHIMVNYWCTIVFKGPLKLDANGYFNLNQDIEILNRSVSLAEYLKGFDEIQEWGRSEFNELQEWRKSLMESRKELISEIEKKF